MTVFVAAWRESAFVAALTALIASAGVHPADAAEQTRAETSVRLVRSQSGTRGTQQANRYVIEDPRSVFSTIDDRQVVVLFEWEAQPGHHHCVARWKDPSGKVVLATPVDYESTSRRFSIYWTLALPERIARGLWAVEASVDGTPAGTHTFEVTDSPAPSPSPSPSPSPAKPLLSQAEIHQRAIASIGILERLGPAEERLGGGPAVALDGDHLVTAFPSIAGATTLRLGTVPGVRLKSQEIGESDRRQGWAVLRFPGHGLAAPPRRSGALAVGARCYVLDSTEDGAWVITEAGVVGEEAPPVGRPRLNMGFAAGSPVFDEYGDLAGIVAGPSREEGLGPGATAVLRGMHVPRGILVVLADRLPMVPTARTRLAALATGGQLPPLSAERQHVMSGVFAGRVQRSGPASIPQDERSVFSRRDGQVSVFIQWSPQRRKDALSRFNLYDADNRLLVKGGASKLELRPRELLVSTWTVGISALPAGMYRVDLLLDEAPVWRGYLRIRD